MSYRDDKAALETQRDELKKALADVTRRAEALADADTEKARILAELSAVEKRLRRADARSLPILEGMRVASPCSAEWDDMIGDDRVRFCGSCAKNVYNLSAMPRGEAEALVTEHEGSVCVRFFRRADGTVLTADCPVGVRRRRLRRVVAVVAGAGAMAMAAGTLLYQGKPGRAMGELRPAVTSDTEAHRTMGMMAPPTTGSAALTPPPVPTTQAAIGRPARAR
jgi:hypothetical protein